MKKENEMNSESAARTIRLLLATFILAFTVAIQPTVLFGQSASELTAKVIKEDLKIEVEIAGVFVADDKDEIAKIAARIAWSGLRLSSKEQKDLKRDREYICSEYVWECYREIGIPIAHDKSGFIAPF